MNDDNAMFMCSNRYIFEIQFKNLFLNFFLEDLTMKLFIILNIHYTFTRRYLVKYYISINTFFNLKLTIPK